MIFLRPAKCLTVFLFLLLSFFIVSAQEKTVSGKVTDQQNGGPLQGVTITVKNKTLSSTTDATGAFSIAANASDVLVFSFTGYSSQEITVGDKTVFTILMGPSGASLDEVVVIGYGTVKRRDLTGSVYSIRGNDLKQTPTFNVIEAMQGRAPGVDITRSSGAAGAGVEIRVRGNRSLNGLNDPLYIIDGFQGGKITDLNSSDIESIEILKDASATAIYGAQGANGVIIITTKKAVAGRTRLSYDGYVGINGYTSFPKPRIGADYVQLRREAYRANGEWSSPADDPDIFPDAGEYAALQDNRWVDWIDLLNQNGTQQSHTVTMSGGSERTKALLSGSYFREEGMLRNNTFHRYSLRANVEHRVTDWFKAGTLSQITFYNLNNRKDPLSAASSISPLGTPYDANGNIVLYPTGDPNRISPLTDERGPNIAKDNNIALSVMANGFVEITPLKGLNFRSNMGVNIAASRRGIYWDATSLERANTKTTQSRVASAFTRNINWDNILTYSKDIGDHSLVLTGLVSYLQSDYDSVAATGYNQLLASQLFYNLGATDPLGRELLSPHISWNNLAFAGRINYSYKGKYLLTLSGRYDGASRLAPGNQWDFFPSAAAAWNVTEENFMKEVGFINNLKIRGSYGVSGNYGIPVYGTQSGLSVYPMGFGDVPAPAYVFNPSIGSPQLGWEKSATTNIGLDVSVLNNRISLTLDLYKTVTSDILLRRTLPPSSGITDVFQNAGETENKGIELAITSQNVRNNEFTWSSTFTFTKNKEEITKLINGKDIISTTNPEENSFLLGNPIGSFYTYVKQGIWQEDKADLAARYKYGSTPFKPGDIMLLDINGDSIIDANFDRRFIGSRVPDFVASLQNTFTWKNFDLSFLLLMRYGQMIEAEFLGRYNPSGEGNGPSIIDYWTPENPTNDFPRPRKGANLSTIFGYQSLFYVDGSFFKIRNVSLGYTLPGKVAKKFYLERFRIYATGSNIFTKARSHLVKDYDPERGGAESAPLTRQFVFGVNVTF